MNTKLLLLVVSFITLSNGLWGQGTNTSINDSFLLRITPKAAPYAGGSQIMERTLPDGSTYRRVMPRFPGGDIALKNFMAQNLRYPEQAKKNKIEGRVVAIFLVNLEGNIEQVRIAKSVDPELDKEVIRMIKSMPKWEPGKTITTKDGKETIDYVKTYYTLPVKFRFSAVDKK